MHKDIKDRTFNLYQRAGFLGLAYSDGEKSEQRIQNAMQHAKVLDSYFSELADAISYWPLEYHLSRQRHHLVHPLGIKVGDRVHAFGSRCGAITRFSSEIGAEVTAVEGSLQRAGIAADRCRDPTNVKIVTDDLVLFRTEERIYCVLVLLVGVFEYAPMCSGEPGNRVRA